MEQIKNLKIKNFRGIKNLNLENLKPITVFLGENSVGKSTVLESLFMISAPCNPFMPLHVTSIRSHGKISLKDVSYMFYDREFNNSPIIEADFGVNDEHRSLSLIPNFSIDESITSDNISILGNNKQDLNGINASFNVHSKDSDVTGVSSFFRNQEGNLEPNKYKDYEERINSVFLSPYIPLSLLEEYGELVKIGKKDVVLQAAQLFDGRITSIETIDQQLFLGYQHLDNMIPLKMAGDGIQKFLCIAIQTLLTPIDVIFIDEIENGLHFTAHQKLWKCILEAAKNSGKQFFISTHNKETLKCLSYFVENDEDSDMMSVITLARENQEIVPYSLTGYGLLGAIDNNLEIRKL